MPANRYRSRTLRRVFRRSPTGVSRLSYRKRADKSAHCRKCTTCLPGTRRSTSAVLKHTPKSYKRAQRPFGGNLCTACMRRALISKARHMGEPQ